MQKTCHHPDVPYLSYRRFLQLLDDCRRRNKQFSFGCPPGAMGKSDQAEGLTSPHAEASKLLEAALQQMDGIISGEA